MCRSLLASRGVVGATCSRLPCFACFGVLRFLVRVMGDFCTPFYLRFCNLIFAF